MVLHLSQRILIPYSEYQRLVASERRLTHLLQQHHKKTEGSGADELAGGGAAAGASAAGAVTVGPLSALVGNLKANLPTHIDTEALPPRPDPLVFESKVPLNEDRILQEAKRNKDLLPSLPLNDPLGHGDPSLPEGMPQTKDFTAVQPEEAISSSGQGAARQIRPWYYQGPAEFSSDEEDNLHLM